jgi:hypothetical protein
MKRLILVLIASAPLCAQRSTLDWPFAGNDAQRTGWEKSDSSITKDTVKDFKLVMKMSLDPNVKGAHAISPPVVLGRLISYRGFKELAFVESGSDRMWAIDADMNRVFWEKHFEKPLHTPKNTGANAAMCTGSVAAMPSLMPPPAFGRGGARPAGAPAGPAATAPPAKPVSAAKNLLSAGGFGGPRPAFAISSDGKLHLMNTSTGEDVTTAMQFIPAGAKASNLTVSNGVVYTTTIAGCGGAPAGVWAMDLNGEKPQVTRFTLKSGDLRGLAFNAEGDILAQTTESLVGLTPKELKVADSFTPGGGMANATPVVFSWQNRELVVAAGKDGRLHVLDAKSLKTALSESESVGSVWGGLSSWQETDGTRWVLAPVWGQKDGYVVALKLEDANGVPKLTKAWTSHEMQSPEPPVITSGVVFTLASGQPNGHATLYAFDGSTGKELYSSGEQVPVPANLTGITLANGRIFFSTTDGTLYGFGIYLER